MELRLPIRCRIAGIGTFLLLAASLPAAETKLTVSTPETCTAPVFGWSVAISGYSTAADRLIVGSPGYDPVSGIDQDRGAVNIFELGPTGWTSVMWSLLRFDLDIPTYTGAQLGYSVSMWADQAVAGAPYLHHRPPGGPTREDAGATLTSYKDSFGDWVPAEQSYGWEPSGNFGFAVALQSSILAEGGPGIPADATHMGLVKTRSLVGGTWWDDEALASSDGGGGFAQSVSTWVNRIAVGAPNDSHTFPGAGAVYLYRLSGGIWSFEQKLTAADLAAGDGFGYSVAMAGNYLAVGAPGKNSYRGRVYVFQLSSGVWSQIAALQAGDGQAADSLGISVASWDPYLVVGASGDDDNGEDAGAVYGFKRLAAGYTEVGKRTAGDGWPHDEYGNSVSIYNGTFAVGSPYTAVAGKTAAGAVYIYDWADLAGHLFSDGFERGNSSRWSSHTP